MEHVLQEGLSFEPGTRPPPCYRLLLFNALAPASRRDVRRALGRVMSMLRELGTGEVRELEDQSKETKKGSVAQFEGLRILLGYGRRFFDGAVHAPPLTLAPRPDYLAYLSRRPAAFPGIPWADPDAENTAEADFAIQLTGEREAAVNCGAVECWKLIEDEGLPLAVVSTFAGFGRRDGRGWLEFHDGVSNIEASQRLVALEAGPDPPWMRGGTYMAFLRLGVDLAAWRRLDRATQELVIGRDKLSGAALISVERDARDALLEASHVHRANQNRASPAASGGLRMFRQGYDFLDGFRDGAPVVGLNFVSFQADLRSLQHVLNLPGWLGDVNFGGPATPKAGDPPSPRFVALVAGGFYALAPRAEPFPGSDLFAAGPS